MRDEVLECWRQEGLGPTQTHLDVFGLTAHERIGANLRPRSAYDGRIIHLSHPEYRRAFDVGRDRFPTDWSAAVRRLERRSHVACVWASRGFFQALGVSDWATLKPVLRATLEAPNRRHSKLT